MKSNNALKNLLLIAAGTCLTANIALATKAHTQKVNQSGNPVQQLGNFIEESGVTMSVYAALTAETALNGTDISVSTDNNVTHLIGKVQNKEQKDKALEVAGKVEGVKEVNGDNLLVPESNQPMTDTWITAKAKAMLLKDRITNSHDTSGIIVTTQNGKIFLTGKATAAEAEHAKQVVDTLEGTSAKAVNNIDTKI